MAARIDPFVDVLLREQGDQLYLLPDEPVTMVKDGKPRKVSRQPLTDQHIYALLVEVAPSESADHIDQMTETEFEYIADRGMVRVRIVPDGGRLTAMVARVENSAATQSPATGPAPAAQRAPAGAGATAPAAPPPRPPKPSAIAAAPMVRSEEHTSELQSLTNLVCRLLLEKKKKPLRNIYSLTQYTSQTGGTPAKSFRSRRRSFMPIVPCSSAFACQSRSPLPHAVRTVTPS